MGKVFPKIGVHSIPSTEFCLQPNSYLKNLRMKKDLYKNTNRNLDLLRYWNDTDGK